ncbi:MAG: hypothetical protein PHH40_04040 [Candidatus Moranbacteria bacterium]|nr:hypothetical protein [Candidatus Moranbacteria bacterium]MDD3964589.1 hypothetical protein [Candidatus Moranbacteria bacterium]
MKRYEFSFIILFMIGALVFVFFASQRKYTFENDTVFVKTPQALTTLKQSGTSRQSVYLLVGEGLPENDYYHAELPALSMGTVDELNKKYGDFRRCSNESAEKAKESIISLQLIGKNADVVKKISTIYKESKKKNDTLIRVSGTELRVIEHTARSNRGKIPSFHPSITLLVDDIETVEKVQ